jgi:predicted nucleotide-binding protein
MASSGINPSSFDRNTVWHLQGSVDDPSRAILTYDGVAIIPANPQINAAWSESMAALRALAQRYTFFFIGSTVPRHWRVSFLDGSEGPHYMLMHEHERQGAQTFFDQLGTPIKVIGLSDWKEQHRILAALAANVTMPPKSAVAASPSTVTPVITLSVALASTRGAIMPDPKKVFIIHGRNMKARDELCIFLRSLGLSPINFMDLRASMGGTPTVAEIVERGMDQAQGVIALITADEYAAVRSDFRYAHDQPDDIQRWQARPNVIFEAGMAFGRDRKRVIFVLLGTPKLFTDVAGIHVLRPNNDPSGDRAALRTTLSQGMGCDIEVHSTDWMRSGDFETCVKSLPGVSPRDPF